MYYYYDYYYYDLPLMLRLRPKLNINKAASKDVDNAEALGRTDVQPHIRVKPNRPRSGAGAAYSLRAKSLSADLFIALGCRGADRCSQQPGSHSVPRNRRGAQRGVIGGLSARVGGVKPPPT